MSDQPSRIARMFSNWPMVAVVLALVVTVVWVMLLIYLVWALINSV